MIVRKNTLKIVAIVSVVGLGTSIYIIADHRRKDKLAATFIDELNKLLNPSLTGLGSEEAFDVNYWDEVIKKVKGVMLLKTEVAKKYAREIYDAWSFWGDDEDKIYSVFRNLRDKVQVSQVADAYKDDYGVNLIEKIRSKLSEMEINQVLQIVNALPRYRVAN